MKKFFKRTFASLMVAVILITAAPLSGFVGIELPQSVKTWFGTVAEAATIVTGKVGSDGITWTFYGNSGTLVFKGKGYLYYDKGVSSYPSYITRFSGALERIVIEEGIEYIEGRALVGTHGMSIYLPKSLRRVYQQSGAVWPTVYYAGTEEEFRKLVASSTYNFGKSKIIFNSTLYDSNNKYSNTVFNIKVVDQNTSYPLNGAKVSFNGKNYYTNSDGTVKLTLTSGMSKNTTFTVSSDTYDTRTISFSELNTYGTSTIKLSQDFDIQELLKGISFPKEIIYGPTIKVLGKSYPLFSIDAKVEIPKLGNYLSINNDTTKKTIKVLVGVKDEYKQQDDKSFYENYNLFKSYYNSLTNNSTSNAHKYNLYKGVNNIAKKLDAAYGFNCNCNFAGFLEYDYSRGYLRLVDGGVAVSGEAGLSKDISFGVFYATFSLSGELSGKLNCTAGSQGVISYSTTTSFKVIPSFGGGVKLISKNLISAEIGIEGEIAASVKIPAQSLSQAFDAYLSANVYVKCKELFLFEQKWKTNFPSLKLYPNTGSFQSNSFGESVLIDENGSIIVPEEDAFELIDRSYLDDITFGTASISPGELNDTSVFPYGYPKLIMLDNGSVVALFVYDDGTKSDINCTTLYYSVYDNNSWSVAQPVCNSGLSDSHAEICTDGEKVYAVWLRASEVYDDSYLTEDIVDKTELVYAEFDGSAWSTPVTVDGAEKYQNLYSIAEYNGNVTVAWAEKDFEKETDMLIVKSIADGMWSDEEIVCNDKFVSEISVGYENGELLVMYSVDTDDDVATTGDSELYINETKITSNDLDEKEISYQNGAFYWLQGNELYTYNSVGGVYMSTGVNLERDYRVLTNGTNTAVTYLETDGFKNELMVSYLINGEYTSPVKLTDYGRHISFYDTFLHDNGTISLLADVENLADEEDVYPYTTTDMLYDVVGDVTDLEVADVTYDGVIARESEVKFTGKVINEGTTTVDSYSINVKDAFDNVICSEIFSTVVNPGGTSEFNLSYLIPSDFVKQDITVEVIAEGDNVTENNIESFTIGHTDIVIQKASINEDGLLTATVVNKGYENAQGVKLSVTAMAETENTLLTTLSLDTVGIGETKDVAYQIPEEYLNFVSAYTVNKFDLRVTTENYEESTENNDFEVVYAPVAVENVLIEEDFITLEPEESITLSSTVEPLNAYNQKVHWVSDSVDIVTVDDNGCVVANGKAGRAIITAISDDGDCVAHCEVVVTGVKTLSNTTLDYENDVLYGLKSNLDSLEGYVEVVDNSCSLSYDTLSTDSIVKLLRGSETVAEYTVIIFGDVNGDSWYDGQDAVLVSCLANGMLKKDDVSEAVYMAADCNHDGMIDQSDVDLLNQAGILLANVDQSKPTEVLLETSSAYVEYLDLIDQSPKIEIEDETEDIPKSDVTIPELNEEPVQADVLKMIMNFIKSIFEMFISYIPVPIR